MNNSYSNCDGYVNRSLVVNKTITINSFIVINPSDYDGVCFVNNGDYY